MATAMSEPGLDFASQAEEFQRILSTIVCREVAGVDALLRVERLSGGASQETYRLTVNAGGREQLLAMRRAPGGMVPEEHVEGHPGLDVEAMLMRAARAAGVPEPEVHYVLEPEDGLGAGFIMQWLEGEALGARITRSEEFADLRPRLAYECGETLARIHAIDLDATGLRDHLDAIEPETFVRQTWERYQDLDTPEPMIDYAAQWLLQHLPQAPEMALVHNDFRNGNFMVTPEGINAVLDWEIAHIGDPMRDLGWICTNSWRFGGDGPVGGFGTREDLFAGYEAVSGTTVDPERVRFWEVFGSYWWAVGCLGMAEHYRTGPDKTVERPAIGRRSSECQIDCVNLIIPGPVALVEPAEPQNLAMPRVDELLLSVRDFLRADVMSNTTGRTQFLARVAGNSLDIVERELRIAPLAQAEERSRLKVLLPEQADTSLLALRWALTNGLRDGSMALDADGLAEHLRTTVVNQIAIDQPRYSGFKRALASSGQ